MKEEEETTLRKGRKSKLCELFLLDIQSRAVLVKSEIYIQRVRHSN